MRDVIIAQSEHLVRRVEDEASPGRIVVAGLRIRLKARLIAHMVLEMPSRCISCDLGR